MFSFRSNAFLSISIFFLLFYSSSAYNITDVLSKYPEFSIFNDYLTKTGVANPINEHRIMTVLVVNNAAMSTLAGKSMDEITKVMHVHAFLDYYPIRKFNSLPNSQTTQVTTLLESPNQERYLNITNGESVTFVSAVGSSKAQLVRDVDSNDSYMTAVVEISNVIVPSSSSSSSSPTPSIPSSSPRPPSTDHSPSPPPPPSADTSPSTPSPSSATFNITRVLNNYPEYDAFNSYLTETQISNQINSRSIVTVFVVNNEAVNSLAGKSTEQKKRVLSLHVIMDYYTSQTLHGLSTSQPTQLTTLLQASFQTTGFHGLLNATNGDAVSFVLAAGSNKASLVKDVYSENSRISLVEISNVILPSDTTPSSSSPSTSPPSPSPSSSPSPSPSSSAFDINKILSSNPDFNLFNTYLTQTQVANQINERNTITIFVLNNGAMTPLMDKPMEIKKKVLSLHVLMDYYTVAKFHNLPVMKSTRINTLLEITDQPSGQQGFLNITNGDTISIVSAAGSDQAVIVRDVSSDERNYISVVQISNIIFPPAIIARTPSNPVTSRAAAPVKAPSSSIASSPMLGNAPLSIAPSDAPTASGLGHATASIARSPIAAALAPHSSGTPAMASMNYVSVMTMILVSAFSLTYRIHV